MDANELLSLKILKDANPNAFKHLAAEETKWLALALGLLRRDVYLQVTMGGKGVRQAMRLAGLLKQKAEQSHFNHRINGVVDRMLTTKFMDSGWGGLAPVNPDRINEFLGFDASNKQVAVAPMTTSTFIFGDKDHDIEMGDRPLQPMSSVMSDASLAKQYFN